MTGKDVYARLPIRTHLITERDDLTEVVAYYTAGLAGPGDIAVLSESMVAIAQGRAVVYSEVRPGILARFLCRFPQKHGSLATPQAMQLAVNEAGHGRIILGAIAAGLGRILGRRGWFFCVAGRELAYIDDIAGTLPPYDRYIVMGPKDPSGLASAIKARIGADAIVADVNDIQKVDIIGYSGDLKALDMEAVEQALRDNPAGNDDQQTPIVVLKRLVLEPSPAPGKEGSADLTPGPLYGRLVR